MIQISKQDLVVWINNIAPTENLTEEILFKSIWKETTIPDLMLHPNTKVIKHLENQGPDEKLVAKMLNTLWGYDRKSTINLINALRALNIERLDETDYKNLAEQPIKLYNFVKTINITKRLDEHEKTLSRWEKIFTPQLGETKAEILTNNWEKVLNLRFLIDRINEYQSLFDD